MDFQGNDTVATAMMFTIKLLAENKDIQRRAREEVLKEIGEEMAFSGIQKLNYLEMCIKESLRLYPNIPTISRKTTTDLQLSMRFIVISYLDDFIINYVISICI